MQGTGLVIDPANEADGMHPEFKLFVAGPIRRRERRAGRATRFTALVALLAGLGGCGNSQSLATSSPPQPARTPVMRCAPAPAADVTVADCAQPATRDRS
jgi:hypothetical protein